MKKYLITVLTLLIMLVGQSAGTAAAAGNVTLLGVSWADNGPVFTFRVSGKFSKPELKGSVHVENGGDYTLHCKQVDDDTVKCTTSEKVSAANVSVTFGGSTFWTYVIGSPDPAPSEFCYSVYDWALDAPGWEHFASHCQETEAEYGDTITEYNPAWEDTFEYVFMPQSPDPEECPFSRAGDGYYYPYSLCELQ